MVHYIRLSEERLFCSRLTRIMIKGFNPLKRGRFLPQRNVTILPIFNTAHLSLKYRLSITQDPYAVVSEWLRFNQAISHYAQNVINRFNHFKYSSQKTKFGSKRFITLGLIAAAFIALNPQGSSYASVVKPDVFYADLRDGALNSTITTHIDSQTGPNFQWTLLGYISQGFSVWHKGIDVASNYNNPVKPVAAGVVEKTFTEPFGYGRTIVVKHNDGFETQYSHLNKIEVKEGDRVTTETEIGTIGLTGRTTGPHVHLEVHEDGKQVNPAAYIPITPTK